MFYEEQAVNTKYLLKMVDTVAVINALRLIILCKPPAMPGRLEKAMPCRA
jgi:hypothetical protein